MLLDFAQKHDIKYELCGKVIVATRKEEIPLLNNVFERGIENGLTKIIQSSTTLSSNFHTYAIEWDADSIKWFFDDLCYNTINRQDVESEGKPWPFDQEFYLILNLAIGGWFAGDVDADLENAQLQVKSIKYYSIDGVGELILH
jgi:hypothetical protein